MTRFLAPAGALAFLLVTGCATNGSVKQQVDPLKDQIAKNEAADADLQKKINALTSDVQGLKQQVQTATTNADAARKAGDDAQAAATRAEDAANRAEEAAKKSSKAFELKQRK